MLSEAKHYVEEKNKTEMDLKDFETALEALDEELSKDAFITAFAPIQLLCSGEFLCLKYLKCRSTAFELDYLLDPEWSKDEDIKTPLYASMATITRQLGYDEDWLNEDMGLFVTKICRTRLLECAKKQGIVLFRGENVIIYGAPMEWALERKIRRIYAAGKLDKKEPDVADALAMMKWIRERDGKQLEREFIRTLNLNTFDMVPDGQTMELLAEAYRERYGEEIFRPGSHLPYEYYNNNYHQHSPNHPNYSTLLYGLPGRSSMG
ncbi:uncharacterized protein GIQ15_05040 [Arthroderma uncinatum]|uniref:uncharacterized protein n=1 Tax=Arthroderma uncinatum TaxID=74035 RepID=UPI00144A7C47|nr:uncharacterized protein GIQ15_05040 [Arthroderma uncinatum]KAF3482281.1 hypothetical protein GIQ15_05040 [Arthroderma uncinatum]